MIFLFDNDTAPYGYNDTAPERSADRACGDGFACAVGLGLSTVSPLA